MPMNVEPLDDFDQLAGYCDIRHEDAEGDGVSIPCFVSVMDLDRAYGGPEEGGWWYDTGHRLETHYCPTMAVYERVMERMVREYNNYGRYPISSVCCEGVFAIYVGQSIPENYPSHRPHYE